MARSPIFARLIEDAGLLETASDVAPVWARSGEGVTPEASATQIEYWRYVEAICFVKASGFAGLKVDWKRDLGSTYLGVCVFDIEYGASYTGATPMGNKTITDTWKKGMKFGLDQSYAYASGPDELDRDDNCDPGDFSYDPSTGAVVTRIGATPGEGWRCGYYMDVIAKSGLDLSVFSPKPSVSGTVFDASTGAKVKPEAMVPGNNYTLQVEMKGFAIKTPALPKQSGFEYVWWGLYASRYHAVSDTGMYLENFDPYWASSWGGVPPGQKDASVGWDYLNNVYAEAVGVSLVPTAPKAIFPPSLMSTSRFEKSDVKLAPNQYNSTTKAGLLYQVIIDVTYLHKGISFITGNDISFSGTPPGVAPIRYNLDVSWDLYLEAAYPDYTCAYTCT